MGPRDAQNRRKQPLPWAGGPREGGGYWTLELGPPSCEEGTAWLLLASEGLRSTPGAGAQTLIWYPGEGGSPVATPARSVQNSKPTGLLPPALRLPTRPLHWQTPQLGAAGKGDL